MIAFRAMAGFDDGRYDELPRRPQLNIATGIADLSASRLHHAARHIVNSAYAAMMSRVFSFIAMPRRADFAACFNGPFIAAAMREKRRLKAPAGVRRATARRLYALGRSSSFASGAAARAKALISAARCWLSLYIASNATPRYAPR